MSELIITFFFLVRRCEIFICSLWVSGLAIFIFSVDVFFFVVAFITVLNLSLFSLFLSLLKYTKLICAGIMKQGHEEMLFVDKDLLPAQQYCIFTDQRGDFSIPWQFDTVSPVLHINSNYLTLSHYHFPLHRIWSCLLARWCFVDLLEKLLI